MKKIKQDIIRAKSLLKMSEEAMKNLKATSFTEESKNMVFREFYESLRQYIESIGYIKGYKFESHEAITSFLKEILKEENLALQFDRYRKLRNGMNYYGDPIDLEIVKEMANEIPLIIKKLSTHLNIK